MKKFIFTIIALFGILMPTSAAEGTAEAYAAFDRDSTILTFYYDDQKDARNGMSVVQSSTSEYDRHRWPWIVDDKHGTPSVITVVFDDSFANYASLVSTAGWFFFPNLTTINGIANLKTDNVTDMSKMFSGCSSLTSLDVSTLNTENVTDMSDMFGGCSSLTSLDVSTFNTENVTDMSYMFDGCSALTSLDLSNLYAPKVTDLDKMFEDCVNLKSLNLSGFKTESVNDMYCTFYGCSSLTELDLSGFNTQYLPSMNSAFLGCSELQTIYVGTGWSTNIKEKDKSDKYDWGSGGDHVFKGCEKLVGGNGTTYDASHIDYTYARIDKEGEPGYFTAKGSGEGKEQVAMPTFAFEYDLFSISCETPDAQIIYMSQLWEKDNVDSAYVQADRMTIDESGAIYIDPFEIKQNIIVKAFAMREGMENSEVVTMVYNYNAWMALKETIAYGDDIYQKAIDNPNVEPSLLENLQWAIEEGDMFYRERANMNSFEAEHFAYRIKEICATIEEQMKSTIELAQDDDGYYLLGSADDWKGFAALASRNSAANAKMTADIDLGDDQTMIASVDNSEKYYQGHFDGQGHTLNVNYIVEYGVAPFRYISNATIENLHVTGRMEASQTSGVGGIVAVVGSENNRATVRRCWSSALLVANTEGSDQNTIGGIVAHSYGNIVIEDCLFDGQFGNENTVYNGGFIANSWGTLTITNGLNVGTYPDNIESNSGTFYRPDQAINDPRLENVYYKNVCGMPQGEQVTDEQLTNGTVVSLLQNGRREEIWKQGEDYPVLYYAADSEKKEQVATPEFSMRGDSIYVICATEGAQIWYKSAAMDSTFNDNGWAIWGDPIYMTMDFKMIAMATKEGMEDSKADTLMYYYTEWQSLIEMIKRCTDLCGMILQENPSDNIITMIQTMEDRMYRDRIIYEESRLEWDRETIIGERKTLEDYMAYLEYLWREEQTQKTTATYENYVLTVEGEMSMAQALEQVGGREVVAKSIAAIIWNSSEAITRSDIEDLGNPNMLIYVQTDSLAPEGVNNVIIDGKAKNIVLVDADSINNNFYAPQEFTAENIQYTREFKQTTEKDVSRGWEGICLPFNVETYTHESHGTIAPFRNNASEYHFWLHQMTDQGMQIATTIEANKPYIISMPNNGSYPAAYNQAGKVTFAAKNVRISESIPWAMILADGSIGIAGAYQSISYGFYALNVGSEYEGYAEGSVFVNNYRGIRPFEVYGWHNGRDNEGAGARFISLSSLFGGNGTTGIIDVMNTVEPNSEVWYDMNGRRLQSKPARKGVYIHNGKKVVIK